MSENSITKPKSKARIALAIGSSLVIGVSLVAGFLGYATLQITDNIEPIKVVESPTPVPETGPLNFLLMGTDTRTGQGGDFGSEEDYGGMGRSDTTMFVHLTQDRKSAVVVSIPRDSMVEIPVCTREDGQVINSRLDRFNSAFALAGPACTIKTFESLTGIKINHAVVVDFLGFSNVVDALGGIEVCLNFPINEPSAKGAGISLPAGVQTLRGSEALGLMRARYTLADGSDLARIKRQQELLAITIDQIQRKNIITDFTTLYRVATAATSSLRMDEGLANIDSLITLAQSVSGLRSKDITFLTVPFVLSPEGNTVVWTEEANTLWSDIIQSSIPTISSVPDAEATVEPEAEPAPEEPATAPLSASEVLVTVLNGTRRAGFAAATSAYLESQGFNIDEIDNAPNKDTENTLLVYAPGNEEKAQLVAQALQIFNLTEDAELIGADVVVILGNDAPSEFVAPVATVEPEPEPSPEPTETTGPPTTGLFCPVE
ncbi:MAG: LCP family protein [Candidatus Nanopelagicales bacterium]